MTDDLLRRFSRLNPVPDPDRLAFHSELGLPAHPVLRAVLEQARATNGNPPAAAHQQHHPQEITMTTLSPPRPEQGPRGQRSARGWLIAAGAAAAAVAVGVVIGFPTLGSDEGPGAAPDDDPAAGTDDAPAPPPADPDVALAQAYVEARNAYSVEQARELVSEDFLASEGIRNLATMELAFAKHEAYGSRHTEGECEGPTADPLGGVVVHCDYLWSTELQRITGYPPVPVDFDFSIDDGRISYAAHDWNRDGFEPNVWDPWIDFLTQEHPDFAELVLAADNLHPEHTPEFIRQMPEHLERYEQWVRAQDG
jgi:hypothetical protein